MRAMNIQDRYNEIAELSGVSEQVVRGVLKAAQQSLSKSLRQGKNATLPGVCTIYPEVRSKIDPGGKSSTQYIKLKAKASSALETEFNNIQSFEKEEEQQDIREILRFGYSNKDEVRTNQITALL